MTTEYPCKTCTNFWCLAFNKTSHKEATCAKFRKWQREDQKVRDDWNIEVFGDVLLKRGEKKK